MKTIFKLLGAAILVVAFTACSDNHTTPTATPTPPPTATPTPPPTSTPTPPPTSTPTPPPDDITPITTRTILPD